jgi:hypothetical protein
MVVPYSGNIFAEVGYSVTKALVESPDEVPRLRRMRA